MSDTVDFIQIITNAALKPKQRVLQLADLLQTNPERENSMINAMQNLRVADQTRVMEAFELYTRFHVPFNPDAIWKTALVGICGTHPSLIRESARVIANLSPHCIQYAEAAIPRLLDLTDHSGTVVRWSAACALVGMYSADDKEQWKLGSLFGAIIAKEEKPSIQSVYAKAIKKKEAMQNKANKQRRGL